MVQLYSCTRTVPDAVPVHTITSIQLLLYSCMVKSYIDANEYAYNILRERMPAVIHQIVLAKGQVMGDSSSEVTNKATEHDYMSVVEQIIISSSTHSVFQADDAQDASALRPCPKRHITVELAKAEASCVVVEASALLGTGPQPC
eukprot:COSAG01_NODE_38_length_33931_cov_75.163632_4_plen_145_part_00